MLLLIHLHVANTPPRSGIMEEEEVALSSCQRTWSQVRVRSPQKRSSPSTHSSLVPSPVLGLAKTRPIMGQDVIVAFIGEADTPIR